MKQEYAEEIVAEMGDDWGEDEMPEVRESYVGRAMSRHTTAVVCASWPQFLEAACRVAGTLAANEIDHAEDFCEAMGRLRQDQMSKSSIIVY